MSLSSRSNQYGKVLGDWNIRKEIGKGSKGTIVYKIVRKRWGRFEETYALKAIPIISERGDYKSLSDRRKDEYQRVLSERAEYATGEVVLMSIVGNHTNIVDYKDHSTAEWEDENGFGCDFLIRMELLRDLRGELERGRIFSEEEVIQIGKDICSALVICHGKDILHRDIKPENIFFNNDGDYKLGDFGIARILDKCPDSYASTAAFTREYAAPEQIKGKYNMSVDIYSLGLVLYELTNQNHLPFAESSYVNPNDVEKRIRSKTLPAPCDASPELAKVIIKACAHAPADRYQSAQEMLDALRRLGHAEPAKRGSSVAPTSTKATDSTFIGSGYDTELALPDSVPTNSGQDSAAQQSTVSEEVRELLQKADAGDVSAQNRLGCCYYYGKGVEKSYSVAAEWFQKAADMGDIDAMGGLGFCYYYGRGVEKNYSIAVEWFQKAANMGNADAMEALGICYYNGNGVDEDNSTAVGWLQKAADMGNVHAMYNLGHCYYYGRGVEKDYSVAVEWYQKAANMGNADAMYYLGRCYYCGHGIDENDSIAVEWFQKAAGMGNASAMYSLGCHYYYFGLGVAKTCSIAVGWFQKAADMGDVLAVYRLGCCYYYGHGVEKNYSLAVEWFQKAADMGNASAMYYIGRCYYCGHGVDKNDSIAVEWFQKAVDMGNAAATVTMYFLGHCHCHEDGVNERIDEDNSISIELLQEVADMGDVLAVYRLGCCYYYGHGVEKNHSLAVEWFQKAADMGNPDAMYWLGRCYSNGTGVGKNYSIAIEWYQKAADEGSADARYLLGYNYY